jgi:DNA polymerase-3 subunit delta'
VRAEAGLFALTAGGGWRVLIVDEADLMNANAANALLKLLEEPPARSLLLLTAHRVGALLPTIRSRCRPLALAPLSAAEVAQAVAGRRPDHDAGARAVAVALADGSIGRALALLDGDGATLNRDLLACWAPDGQLLWERAWALADRAQRLDGDGFLMLERLLRGWLGRLARVAASGGQGIDPAERPRAEAIVRRYGLERILAMWENAGDLFQRADGLNLQRRQTVLAVFGALDPPTAPTKRPT